MNTMRILVVSLAASTGLPAARAGTVNANPSNPTPTTTEITITVTPGQGETMKDFHILPPKGSKLKAGTPGGAPSGWSFSPSTNDGINIFTTGGGITNNPSDADPDSLSFTMTYSHGTGGLTKSPIFWAITSDGNDKVGSGGKHPIGPGKTKPGDTLDWGGPGMTGSAPDLPLNTITFRPGGSVLVGTDMVIPLETTVADHVYKVFLSVALSNDDPNDLGIDVDQPIPSEWGITVTPDRGLFEQDAAGDFVASPVLRIPNNPGLLVGNVFYGVWTIDLDGDSRPDIRTPVRQFTIQSSGSTDSGIVDLD